MKNGENGAALPPMRIGTHAAAAVVGGLGYNLIELMWRGRTHWTMFLLGGACFEAMGLIHRHMRRTPLAVRGAVCAGTVTTLELLCGCVVNLWLHMDVWDYSDVPFNILGQICPLYTGFWYVLGLLCCPVYRLVCAALTFPHDGQISASGH